MRKKKQTQRAHAISLKHIQVSRAGRREHLMQDTLELLGSAADEPGDPETVPGLHGSPRHEPHHAAPFQPPLFCLGRDVCLVLCVAASSLMQSRSKRAAGLARRIASFLPFAGGCADSLGIFLIFFLFLRVFGPSS